MSSPASYAAFVPAMLAEDRKRAGWSVEQAARRLRVSQAIYRELEAGRGRRRGRRGTGCKVFGWPQTLVAARWMRASGQHDELVDGPTTPDKPDR
jgi:hypothetical protein